MLKALQAIIFNKNMYVEFEVLLFPVHVLEGVVKPMFVQLSFELPYSIALDYCVWERVPVFTNP